jgi:hypothetical protein
MQVVEGEKKKDVSPSRQYQERAEKGKTHFYKESRMEGSVQVGLDLWRVRACQRLVGLDKKGVIDRTILWSALQGASPQPIEMDKEREMTVIEQEEEARLVTAPKGCGKIFESKKNSFQRSNGGKGSGTRSVESTTRSRTHGLSIRAKHFAEQLSKSTRRMRGFFRWQAGIGCGGQQWPDL